MPQNGTEEHEDLDLDLDDDSEDNSEDDSDDESPSTVTFTAPRSSGKKDLQDLPVENANSVPLFSDTDKRGLRSIDYLSVIKIDQPGQGFKGKLPKSATLTTLYELYGNGVFTIEAYNHRHQKIREVTNVRIDIPSVDSERQRPERGQANGSNNQDSVLGLMVKSKHASHEAEIKRTERLALVASDTIKEQSKAHVEMVVATSKESADRERTFM